MTLRAAIKALAFSAAVILPGPALAASCGSGNFEAWLADFKSEAASKGISQGAISAGLSGVTLDQAEQADVVTEDAVPTTVPGGPGMPERPRHSGQIRLDGDVVHQSRHRTSVPVDHVERRGQVAEESHAGHRCGLAVGVEGPPHLAPAPCSDLRRERRPVRSGRCQELDLEAGTQCQLDHVDAHLLAKRVVGVPGGACQDAARGAGVPLGATGRGFPSRII